jgi:diguanylate cyclase (GGDEF)-like protein
MRAADLLRVYARGLCALTGAEGLSLYLPSRWSAPSQGGLAHFGDAPPPPELADAAHAEHRRRQAAAELAHARFRAPERAAFELASAAADGRLIGVFSEPPRVPERRGRERAAPVAGSDAGPRSPAPPDLLVALRFADAGARAAAPPLEGGLGELLRFAGELARHAGFLSEVLDDPVTGLPGRAEFQAGLEAAVRAAREEGLPVTLLMVNPDGFAAVSERLSAEAADRVVGELAERLRSSHRTTDLVARYGSVVFASILPDTDAREGEQRAEQILRGLHAAPFLGGGPALRFSLGMATLDAQDAGAGGFDLIRRANLALSAAKRAGGSRSCAWRPGLDEDVGYLDRLLGVFTGQMAKDYRNMAVLSDTVSLVAGAADFRSLAGRVVDGLQSGLKLEQVGLFEWREAVPALIEGVWLRAAPDGSVERLREFAVGAEERRCLEEARRRRRPVERRRAQDRGRPSLAFAVPLLVDDACLGALYLAGRVGSTSLDGSDAVFLGALATQVALALDRARLTDRQRLQEEKERRRLQAEVEELRGALRRTQLLYRSGQMEELLATVRRVAPTDATVLITGESGTGKEMLARAIHELSPRREHPFLVVDCAAIPTTLIESELFGHEKGAFTGAQQRRLGRLLQADRGTLLLDEIGELPTEVQSRLLRFVQDKQVTAVGGGSARAVDVRILAATNRDLMAEVQAGRFRADLYHRLNVVRLEIPPLRQRPDDILHLAHHFRDTYALLYGKGPLPLTAEAEALVQTHPWPGNVRELQNRVMRAVILARGDALTPADLGFVEASPAAETRASVTERHPGPAASAGAAATPLASGEAVWGELREALSRQVDAALRGARQHAAPLGRWLAEDLVLEADAAAGGVASRAAALLGMPETTFRRRLERSAAQARAAWAPRPAAWHEVRRCLARLLAGPAARGSRLLVRTQRLLLEEVLSRAGTGPRLGAALLGVTQPTFLRRRAALAPGRSGRDAGGVS